jgi:hypothetical protein
MNVEWNQAIYNCVIQCQLNEKKWRYFVRIKGAVGLIENPLDSVNEFSREKRQRRSASYERSQNDASGRET